MLRLWGESGLSEQFNEIARKLLSPAYDPKTDRPPTADEAVDTDMANDDREEVVDTGSAAAKLQPKNTELAALEQSVQKSAKQGIHSRCLCMLQMLVVRTRICPTPVSV